MTDKLNPLMNEWEKLQITFEELKEKRNSVN
jgi:hypothetical protein